MDKSLISQRLRDFRPDFLESCFGDPEQFYFNMIHECGCQKRRNNGIKVAYMAKVNSVIECIHAVQKFTDHFLNMQDDVSLQFKKVGVPSNSFLFQYSVSHLFENEDKYFNLVPENNGEGKPGKAFTLKFFQIRQTFQKSAANMSQATQKVR